MCKFFFLPPQVYCVQHLEAWERGSLPTRLLVKPWGLRMIEVWVRESVWLMDELCFPPPHLYPIFTTTTRSGYKLPARVTQSRCSVVPGPLSGLPSPSVLFSHEKRRRNWLAWQTNGSCQAWLIQWSNLQMEYIRMAMSRDNTHTLTHILVLLHWHRYFARFFCPFSFGSFVHAKMVSYIDAFWSRIKHFFCLYNVDEKRSKWGDSTP